MTDYTELVKALRCCKIHIPCKECPKYKSTGSLCVSVLHDDAAAAIQELQAELEKKRTADCWGCKCEKLEPKRGKWIIDGAYTYNLRELNGKAYEPVYRCSCCNRQTESYVRLDEPKMPEDADFPEYCPHCGAKMEVQE